MIFIIQNKYLKKNVNLRTRKGVYPYDNVSSLEKLSETQLPPKEEFYSKLNDEDITDDDYQHAINVWNTFECKTQGHPTATFGKISVRKTI